MDWLIFGSINIILIVVLFLFMSRRLHRQYNSEHFMAEVQREVNAIITELNQTTERNLQLIEERMDSLSALTAQLDRRILLAKSEEERRNEATGTYSQLQEQRRQIQREMTRTQSRPPPVVAAVSAEIFEPEPEAAPGIGSKTMENPAPGPVQQVQSREAMKHQVAEMSRAGIAATLIAQHFGISLGEVELIISLQAGRSE